MRITTNAQLRKTLKERLLGQLDKLMNKAVTATAEVIREEVKRDAQEDAERALIVTEDYEKNRVIVSDRRTLSRMTMGDEARVPMGTYFRIKRRLNQMLKKS